ncbi:MAG: hypothetical protein O8C67_14855 [Candidatus Methanoperedens sp.]|nr:hypothetical protein [Candidatus Methanoperedens sp.]
MNADLLHGRISHTSGCFCLRRRAGIRGHNCKARRVSKEMAARGSGKMGGGGEYASVGAEASTM